MFVYTTAMCDGGGDVEALERLLGAIESFVALPAGEVTPFELGERLIRLRHGIDLLELRFAREAAALAATDEADAQGSTSSIDWVRHQCRMSGRLPVDRWRPARPPTSFRRVLPPLMRGGSGSPTSP